MKRSLRHFSTAAALAFSMTFSSSAAVFAEEDQAHIVTIDVAIGKSCAISAFTNAANEWTMRVMNGDKLAALYKGAGTDFKPMVLAEGESSFVVEDSVKAFFSAGSDKFAVRQGESAILTDKQGPSVFSTLIGGEDGSDDGWQDIVATITCLRIDG